MAKLEPLYGGLDGECSATFRPATTPPEYVTPKGTNGYFLATPGEPSSRFSLYRWDMSAASGGPGPHFHRTYDETFIVLRGTVRLFDGHSWYAAAPGDMLHAPAGGIHAFTNDSGKAASMLMLLTPAVDRGAYFAELARLAAAGVAPTSSEWEETMLRHDNVMLK